MCHPIFMGVSPFRTFKVLGSAGAGGGELLEVSSVLGNTMGIGSTGGCVLD
jgi:hypothetical protein